MYMKQLLNEIIESPWGKVFEKLKFQIGKRPGEDDLLVKSSLSFGIFIKGGEFTE